MAVGSLLSLIIELGKIDGAIARVVAEKKRYEKELEGKRTALQRADLEVAARQKAFSEKQVRYKREESEIRDEQEKLVQRRKALSTLNNYKVQQSAEREIEAAARQLQLKEETLLNFLQEVDDYEKLLHKATAESDKLRQELAQLESDAKAAFVTLEERQASYEKDRAVVRPKVDAVSLRTYERLRARYPMDVVVELKGGSCIGCYMSVGPQVVVEITKGEKLVQCPGCNRLLYIAESTTTA